MKEYRLRVKEKIMKADLATIRREYTKGGLKRSDLPDNPLVLFTKWLQEAIDAEVNEPTAMLVGTVSPEGKPAIRTVLLKDLHDGKLFFILTMEVARVNIWLITHLSLYRLYGMNWKGKFI